MADSGRFGIGGMRANPTPSPFPTGGGEPDTYRVAGEVYVNGRYIAQPGSVLTLCCLRTYCSTASRVAPGTMRSIRS